MSILTLGMFLSISEEDGTFPTTAQGGNVENVWEMNRLVNDVKRWGKHFFQVVVLVP